MPIKTSRKYSLFCNSWRNFDYSHGTMRINLYIKRRQNVFHLSFSKRVWVALVSICIFSFLFALINYVPKSEQLENVYYFKFSELFMFSIIYASPVYLLGGIPVSYLADWLLKKKEYKRPYLIGIFIYSISGFLLMIIDLFLISGAENLDHIINIFFFSILGIPAAIIFFLITLLFTYIGSKWNNSKNT